VCISVLNLVQQGGNIGIVANSFGILAEMLKWYKKHIYVMQIAIIITGNSDLYMYIFFVQYAFLCP
jgi:hypothetical protein